MFAFQSNVRLFSLALACCLLISEQAICQQQKAEATNPQTDVTPTADKDAAQCDSETCGNETCKESGSCSCADSAQATSDTEEAQSANEKEVAASEATSFQSTHKQSRNFKPHIDDKPAWLSTFRLATDGELVACVSHPETSAGYIQTYSPKLELTGQFELPFSATALDIDPSGNLFVGGEGKIGKLTANGKILLQKDTSELSDQDPEELKKELLEQLQMDLEAHRQHYERQLNSLQERIEKLEDIAEDERTEAQQKRLKRLTSQAETYQQELDQMEVPEEIDDEMLQQRLAYQSSITAIAVTEQDVFVAMSAVKGYGYDVYRLDHELESPEKILTGLRGCCGQMDIHASGGKLYVAENTNFKVGIYDRDGEKVSKFGQRLNKDNQGFGSCCNPMNVLCCSNGDILTAESSIGKIKRFNAEGEMIGYVGRARIGGGCKHVALSFDAERDVYYIQYEDRNEICVLSPKGSQAVPVDPRVAELTDKLVGGKWELTAAKETSEQPDDKHVGIGVELEQNEQGQIVIKSIIENSPAAKQKRIQVGDVILAVGDATIGSRMSDAADMKLADVRDILCGSAGQQVRVRYHSTKTDKVRRSKFKQVEMQLIDGEWIAEEADDFMDSFSFEELSNMKSLEFHPDGSLTAQLANQQYADIAIVDKWLATGVEGDTLLLDSEDGQGMIIHRLKIKFEGPDSALISVTYDAAGDQEGEFKKFERASDQETESQASAESETDLSAAVPATTTAASAVTPQPTKNN